MTTPITSPNVVVSGSLRVRGYSWGWFGDTVSGDYAYPGSVARVGLAASKKGLDWHAEFAVPLLLDLPTHAVAAAPQGQLGLGASYFAANSSRANTAGFFLKQGFIRFTGLPKATKQSLTVGRMEFNDGAETVPTNSTLAALKRDRISQRLLGTFGFTDVGRSVDGAQYSLSLTKVSITALAARPTQGVFDANGWPELNINVFYGALTGRVGGEQRAGDWRLFALGYNDSRRGVVKTDNRSSPARSADTGSIAIETYGGHYIQSVGTSAGTADLLLWGAVQTGAWGGLTQQAAAFAAEAGWQPTVLAPVAPWLRAGYDYGSGDHDPNDQTHGTFFQVLPTPRIYARTPFYNMMNTEDTFGTVMLRPAKTLTLRSDVHALRLTQSNDLWYGGGGAFQALTFGYTGRPSGGYPSLATLYDVSADFNATSHLALSGYWGYAASHAVVQTIYPAGGLRFGYIELFVHF